MTEKARGTEKNNRVSNFKSSSSSAGKIILAPTQLTTTINKILMKEKNHLLHLIPGILSTGGIICTG
ncbi:hypothetical protein, partial [Enterobacter hormaechei]|uniref:hypothetical protein n=2 Tax=Enterobacteriaceae TaxID=543 RepID=UPI0025A2A824